MKCIVAQVVNNVADLKCCPKEDRKDRITEFDYLANREVPKREDHTVNGRRQHQSIPIIVKQLRIIRQHMVYPMRKEVKIMGDATVWDISVTMKDKSMKAILHKGKEDQSRDGR